MAGTAVQAQAGTTVQSITGDVLKVSGDAGANDIGFDYLPASDTRPQAYTAIYDGGGVTVVPALLASGRCTKKDPDEPPASPDLANYGFCKDSGAFVIGRVEVDLQSGADGWSSGACYEQVSILGGDGNDEISVPGCPAGTYTLDTGGGDDRVGVSTSDGGNTTVKANLGEGGDTFNGGRGNSEVHAGGGADTLTGATSVDDALGVDRLFGDDGDDAINGYAGPDVIDGGNGGDILIGGAADDTLTGGSSDDVFSGGEGNDTLDGGDGDDQFDRERRNGFGEDDPGADTYIGGAGNDVADFNGREKATSVSLNDQADDGSSDEHDNIRGDIERIDGSPHNDYIVGNDGPNVIDAYSGDDTIYGRGGNDGDVEGGSGNDKIYGEAGDDTLYGDSGNDIVDGGVGVDKLFGDTGFCDVNTCAAFNDEVYSRDGAGGDQVQCGGGADKAFVDGGVNGDVVAKDGIQSCEQVDEVALPGPGGGPGGGGNSSTLIALRGKPSIKKGVGATVTCKAACTYTVAVVLGAKYAKKYRLGRKSVTIAKTRGTLLLPGSKRVTLKLTKKARSRLKRASKVPATIKITVKDGAGKTDRGSKTFTLRK